MGFVFFGLIVFKGFKVSGDEGLCGERVGSNLCGKVVCSDDS